MAMVMMVMTAVASGLDLGGNKEKGGDSQKGNGRVELHSLGLR